MRDLIDKRPREYADEIISLPTIECRKKALAEVPENIRELVKRHVVNAFMIRKFSKGLKS